jgi:DNA-binding SARP family transcriptional activator
MNGLQIKLFGDVSVHLNDWPVPRPPGKSLELFCYLLIYRGRPQNREVLAEFLWPDDSANSAKRYLRQALWKLNAALPRTTSGDQRAEYLTSHSPGWIGINPEAEIRADLTDFDQAYLANRETRGLQLTDEQADQLDAAVRLYRGDLFIGCQQEWCIPARNRARQAYLTMLEQLMGYCETHQYYERGLEYGQLVLDHDVARETAHRQLMRLHHRAGNRTAAIRQYRLCLDAMADELEVGPSADTVDLYRQICVEPTTESLTDTVAHGAAPSARRDGETLAEVYSRLDQIQASLQSLLGFMTTTWAAGLDHADG